MNSEESFAIVFPGQGSQYPGMGLRLYQEVPLAKQLYKKANDIVGFDLLDLNNERQFKTSFAQPAIYSLSVIAYFVLREQFSIHPSFMTGHSLGEYSALACSGSLDFFEGLELVHMRGKVMEETVAQSPAAMCAVEDFKAEDIKEILAKTEGVFISSFNSYRQTVISGWAEQVKAVAKYLQEKGATTKFLSLNLPFHTPLLDDAADTFKSFLDKVSWNLPKTPVISSVTGKLYSSINEIKLTLEQQIVLPVKWLQTMQFLSLSSVNRVIECGPKKILSKFFQDSFPKIACRAFEFPEKEIVSKEKKPFTQAVSKALVAIATTKNYQSYDPLIYQRIENCYDNLKNLKNQETHDLNQIRNLLKEALTLKKLPEEDVAYYINQLSSDIQLFCFPYAGGSSFLFKEWQSKLPSNIQVIPIEYPGRGVRVDYQTVDNLDVLLPILEAEVRSKICGRFAFFGHSLGGLIAYELAHLLSKNALNPSFLFLSACPAPNRIKKLSEANKLGDEYFIEQIKKMNGTPIQLIDEKEFQKFFLPILKADFSLLEDYNPDFNKLISCSVHLYGGKDDALIGKDHIEAWKLFSSEPPSYQEIDGDHFYIRNPDQLLGYLAHELTNLAENKNCKQSSII